MGSQFYEKRTGFEISFFPRPDVRSQRMPKHPNHPRLTVLLDDPVGILGSVETRHQDERDVAAGGTKRGASKRHDMWNRRERERETDVRKG